MSWHKRFAYASLALILGFTIGLAAMGFSPVLAALCPKCFGFEKLSTSTALPAQHRVYIEAGHEAEAQALAQHYVKAIDKVGTALAPFEKHPILLSCVTARCHALMGGHKALAITYGTALIYFSPKASQPHIVTHELSHVALHRKLGLKALGDFPTWVDEGIATYISQDRRLISMRAPVSRQKRSCQSQPKSGAVLRGRTKAATVGNTMVQPAVWWRNGWPQIPL